MVKNYKLVVKWCATMVEDSFKKAHLSINSEKTNLKIWLTNIKMTHKAKGLVKLLKAKTLLDAMNG